MGVPGGAQTRVLVVAETSQEVTVIERSLDIGGDPSWINSVTEIMRVQAQRADPLFGKRSQSSFTDAEFADQIQRAAWC